MTPEDTIHREDLSSLLDGALDADRTRFLLRRLQHDDELAGCVSRWQLAGDALRGQAHAPAPAGFAERVAARIAIESLPLDGGQSDAVDSDIEFEDLRAHPRPALAARATAKPRPLTAARLRWFGGGALAASLAMAVVWNARDGVPAALPTAAPQIATVTAPMTPPAGQLATGQTAPASKPEAASRASVAASTTGDLQLASAASARMPSANATQPQRAVRVARANAVPASNPAAVSELPVAGIASVRTAQVDTAKPTAIASADAKQADPFQPPAARAWPKATIPGVGQGMFNARLDGSADSPFALPARNPVQGQGD